MKTTAACFVLSSLIGAFSMAVSAESNLLKAVFEEAKAEQKWTLKELSQELPANWSGYEFLTMEFRSSTAQRFELRIYTTNGMRHVLVHPYQGAWIRASIPLAYFTKFSQQGSDLSQISNRSRVGYWITLLGNYGPVDAVESIGVLMQEPIGSPSLEIRSVRVDKESPGDAVLEPKPLVDEFGQWLPEDWPGKAKTLDELKAGWAAEDGALHAGEFGCCQYGGFTNANAKAKATGFFRVEEIDGKWWFVDPDGHLFFSTGADSMNSAMVTPMEGRAGVFAELPPASLRTRGFRQGNSASFYTWNLVRRFGTNYTAPWVDLTMRRMDNWGLNTVASWGDARLWEAHRKAYVVILRGWGGDNGSYLGLPDVYSERFAQRADEAAADQCAPRKDDPWLLGYFVGNEPPWPGHELEIAAAILEGPAVPIQRELKAFLAEGDTRERRREFVNQCIEKFFNVVNAAIRKNDPNHLNLGNRFGSRPSEAMLRASRGFDVFSFNNYAYEVNPQALESAHRITGKPILIGEFHIGTPGRGLAAGLVQAANQEERGMAYRYYVENAAANPALIGAHWFEWIDEPNTGRFDGENYNIGFVDVTDRPYAELVEAAKATHARLFEVHSGKTAPVGRKAKAR